MSEDKTQGSTGADTNEEKRALNEVSVKYFLKIMYPRWDQTRSNMADLSRSIL